MTILKIQKVGEQATFACVHCEAVEGQYGMQVKFTSATGDVLYLPQSSADNQLGRLDLDYAACVGRMLTFSRSENKKPGSAPYWNVALASATTPGKRIASPHVPAGINAGAHIPDLDDFPDEQETDGNDPWDGPTPYRVPQDGEPPLTPREEQEAVAVDVRVAKRGHLVAFYHRLYAHNLTEMMKAHAAAGDETPPVTAEACQALTATLVIQMEKKGLLP